jgi:hypothetical protein
VHARERIVEIATGIATGRATMGQYKAIRGRSEIFKKPNKIRRAATSKYERTWNNADLESAEARAKAESGDQSTFRMSGFPLALE